MKKLPTLIGFQRRQSDRSVLSCVALILLGLLLVAAVVALSFFWQARWRPQVGRDRRTLDAILATKHIDHVAIFNGWNKKTNWLSGIEARNLVRSLQPTNRVANIDWTKQQVELVVLFEGTNQLAVLSQGEDRAWEFG